MVVVVVLVVVVLVGIVGTVVVVAALTTPRLPADHAADFLRGEVVGRLYVRCLTAWWCALVT